MRYLYCAALLVGTSEYSEWIEGGMIRVAQTQKREYANLMVVYKCSVDGVSQRSTGTMSIKALPSRFVATGPAKYQPLLCLFLPRPSAFEFTFRGSMT